MNIAVFCPLIGVPTFEWCTSALLQVVERLGIRRSSKPPVFAHLDGQQQSAVDAWRADAPLPQAVRARHGCVALHRRWGRTLIPFQSCAFSYTVHSDSWLWSICGVKSTPACTAVVVGAPQACWALCCLQKGGNRTRKPTVHSRSYAPGSLSTFQDDAESMKVSHCARYITTQNIFIVFGVVIIVACYINWFHWCI